MTSPVAYASGTALIVVDVQNDFASEDGSLFVPGAPDLIPFINDQIEAASEAHAMVVRTQDWHPEVTPHFAKDGGIWPVHCVAGTWGAEFHPDLLDVGSIVRKGVGGEDGYSGFTVRDPVTGEEQPTGLADTLHEAGITDVVVVGLATDYCVMETAVDAVTQGFQTTLLADGIAAVNLRSGDGARACATMVRAGVEVR